MSARPLHLIVCLGVLASASLAGALAQGMDQDGPGPYGAGPGGPEDGPGMDGRMRSGGMRGGGLRGGGMDDEGEGGRGGGSAGMTEQAVTVGGAQRPYYIHIPQNVGHPAPVVFVFHGGGGRPQGIARKSNMDEVADQNGFIVIYPEGSASPSGRGGRDLAIVADRQWHRRRRLRRCRPQGRRHAHADRSLADLRRRAFDGAASFPIVWPVRCRERSRRSRRSPATMVEPSCNPTSPVAVLHIQGSADDRIPLRGGRGQSTREGRDWPAPQKGVAAWSRFDACEATPSTKTEGIATCETYAGCKATVEMCILSGEGHPWPQDAAPKIWAFFAAHPKVSQ